MCGRFGVFAPSEALAAQFGLKEPPDLAPRYNISPGQAVPFIRAVGDGHIRELAWLHWGLIPRWAKGPDVGSRLINARAETVFEKPAFRGAVRKRRGLIPADGFYEWTKKHDHKQPYFFYAANGLTLALAGLWERWEGPDETVESCTILTTTANRTVKKIHDRMPVILAPESYARWLEATDENIEGLRELLAPWPDVDMKSYAVSPYVNNTEHEGPRCIEPAEQEQLSLL
jgi:putative SOS response-associated peptidase YedK